LTQAQVAEEIGIAVEVYGRLERGVIRPSVQTLMRIAQVLRVTPNDLLTAETGAAALPEKAAPPELSRIVRLLESLDRRALRRAWMVLSAMFSVARRPTKAKRTPRRRRRTAKARSRRGRYGRR